MGPENPKIFLSSTYVDLHPARQELAQWLSGVFGAGMVIMESFGSEAAPPNVVSVKRVRDSDIFIGLYGHRYGTIDPSTGRSITELELDEARSGHSAGTIRGLLLYVVGNDSKWLSDFRDVSIEAEKGRARLRDKASQHTYTSFKNKTDLLFKVIRDVYRLIRQSFSTDQRPVRSFNIPFPRKAIRPIGMEFLTSSDREYLIGRGDEVAEAIALFEQEPISLLLGESGVGKTSLVHAGIVPETARRGWRPVYVRPFNMPCRDIVEQIEASIFVGGVRHRPLFQTIAEVLTALDSASGNRSLLLIIDQFEDVLSTSSEAELNDLISGLSALRELSAEGLHVLISYRSDLEGRLGTLWQRISGSPRGFPRIYVSGLKVEALWPGVEAFCNDLGIELQLSATEIQQICGDVVVISKEVVQSKVYPPYVQMFLDNIWHAQIAGGPRRFTYEMYERAGRIVGIVSRYLAQQLQYANDDTGELRLLLIALVRSYGTKAQRTLQELSADTGMEAERCEVRLERLIDLRLVRHISDRYEVSHDFLAKMILEELVDLEEREYKRFRELLTSRAVAFATTTNKLTIEEVLFLYKYRHRLALNKQEAGLIIDTWITENVPGLFWIREFDPEWVKEQVIKYDGTQLDTEERYSTVFLKSFFKLPIRQKDFLALTGTYKMASEAAQLFKLHRDVVPLDVIWAGLRNKRSEIRDSCFDALLHRLSRGDVDLLRQLRRNSGWTHVVTYFRLATTRELFGVWDAHTESLDVREFAALHRRSPALSSPTIHARVGGLY
jgi:hypothetical protein